LVSGLVYAYDGLTVFMSSSDETTDLISADLKGSGEYEYCWIWLIISEVLTGTSLIAQK